MNLLIFGGSGFVSKHLVDEATSRGHHVWCVTRGNRHIPADAHTIKADRNDTAALNAALDAINLHWDAVIDCICFEKNQARADIEILQKYTNRIIVISTDSVYHPHYKKVPQDECGEKYLTDGGYGAKKREMEQVFETECSSKLKWTIFRPGHIFGPGSELGCFPEQSRQADLIEQMQGHKPMRLVGGGEYLIHPIYVGDLVRVMLDAIDCPATYNQIFCIGGPEIIVNKQYYEILANILNVPICFETIPEEGYLEEHPASSGHLCHRAYNLTKLAETGIQLPDTSIENGLRRQVEYLLAQKCKK